MIGKLATVGYGAVAYGVFLVVFAYLILFLADAGAVKGVDDGSAGPARLAVVVDGGLLTLFAAQHSVMARPWFKRRLTRLVAPSIERSTYVLAASAALVLLLWQWRPLPATVWAVAPGWTRVALWIGYAIGWAVAVLSSFALDHFELFGLRQVARRSSNRAMPEPSFRQPRIYRCPTTATLSRQRPRRGRGMRQALSRRSGTIRRPHNTRRPQCHSLTSR